MAVHVIVDFDLHDCLIYDHFDFGDIDLKTDLRCVLPNLFESHVGNVRAFPEHDQFSRKFKVRNITVCRNLDALITIHYITQLTEKLKTTGDQKHPYRTSDLSWNEKEFSL